MGKLYINGVDVYEAYHAYLLNGSYGELLAYPTVKNVTQNDWFEEDGLEVDATRSVFAGRSMNIAIGISGDGNWQRFTAFLNERHKHTVTVEDIGITDAEYRFGGVSGFNCTADGMLARITVRYFDDALSLYEFGEVVPVPEVTTFREDSMDINGVNFGQFGLTTLTALDSFRRPHELKTPLIREIESRMGTVSDLESPVKLSGKNLTVKALMRAADVDEFWHNYLALLHEFHRQECTLDENNTFLSYDALYTGGRFEKVSIGSDGSVWAIVTLSFVTTSASSATMDGEYLAYENGIFVVTEDDEYLIDTEL